MFNRNTRINLFNMIKNMFDISKKHMSKEQTYINIVLYYYREVISEQNIFDLFFFYRKFNKANPNDFLYKSIFGQKKNDQLV